MGLEFQRFLDCELSRINISRYLEFGAYSLAEDIEQAGILFWDNDGPVSQNHIDARLRYKQEVLVIFKTNPGFITAPEGIETAFCKENQFYPLQKALADELYPISPHLIMVGVTGTNGKTTTVDLLRQMLNQNGIDALSVGTLGVIDKNNHLVPSSFTTPPFFNLRKIIFQHQIDHRAFIFEVSSHALVQKRTYGILWDFCGWTSFSQDHLDYHLNMNNYFNAKLSLVKNLKPGAAFILPQSMKKFLSQFPQEDQDKLRFVENEEGNLIENSNHPFFKIPFNLDNFSLAYGITRRILNRDPNLGKLTPPKGRFEVISQGERNFVIDFAHTPDAIEKLCEAVRISFPEKYLVLVFGCGGNRDASKRRLMGEIAQKKADELILTSDNPRFEDPSKIIDDICGGITEHRPRIILDRMAALEFAATLASSHNVIVIAGKGHEEYQEISGVKYPFSDAAIIKNLQELHP